MIAAVNCHHNVIFLLLVCFIPKYARNLECSSTVEHKQRPQTDINYMKRNRFILLTHPIEKCRYGIKDTNIHTVRNEQENIVSIKK